MINKIIKALSLKCMHCGKTLTHRYHNTDLCKEDYWLVAYINGGLRNKELFKRMNNVMSNTYDDNVK